MEETKSKGLKNLTLRLPDEYHDQLTRQANQRGLTLNAHLLNIVQRHLMESGFAPDVIKSFSGRLFEVHVEPIPRGFSDYFSCRFDVYEYHPLYTKMRAYYVFGVSSQLTGTSDPFGVVKDIGLALLNFYNRKGFEIDQLAWQSVAGEPMPSNDMKDNWRYIGTDIAKDARQLMIALGRDHWRDDRLVLTGQAQDIRCNRRTEEDLYR